VKTQGENLLISWNHSSRGSLILFSWIITKGILGILRVVRRRDLKEEGQNVMVD